MNIDLTQGKLCTKEQSAGLIAAAPVSNEHAHEELLLNAIAASVPSETAPVATPVRHIDLRFGPSRQLRRLLTVSLSGGGYVYAHAFVKGQSRVRSIAFASAQFSDCYIYELRGDYNLWCGAGTAFSLLKREADELVEKLGIRAETR